MNDGAAENTDLEIWRERPGDYYSPSIHVTREGGIGINVGGHVFVLDVYGWHRLAHDATVSTLLGKDDGLPTAADVRGILKAPEVIVATKCPHGNPFDIKCPYCMIER